ncbi:hypothetical protein FNF31_07757 [Cafeteria roenbergensis]|uniref:Uncharacterized protein n=1 Tax=Cafeteria roenbergensis TaxID=33653 RepID=A0A5A8C3Y1_CAFRO|nr:hypothetical protein FNF31_07757 [Cafeteria roenbergensis]KAA0169990.1 hypothetical protein FNF28_01780 [Cafeteria roenbergensis]
MSSTRVRVTGGALSRSGRPPAGTPSHYAPSPGPQTTPGGRTPSGSRSRSPHATAAGTVDLSPAIGALVGRAPGCAVPPGDVDWAQLEGSAGFASAVSGAATSRSALAETAFGLSGIKHPSTPFSGRGSVFGGASSFGRASGSTAFGRSTRPRLGATTASGGKAFMPRAFNSSAGFRTGGSAAGLGEDLSYPGVRGSLAESPGLLGCLCRLWAIVGGGSM